MSYETFRLTALAAWLDEYTLCACDHHEVQWANECVAAGIVFA